MRVLIVILLVLFSANYIEAAWLEPEEIVSGDWGDSSSSFGLRKGESTDEAPNYFCVTNSNYIAIADSINFRIKIYKDKVLVRIIDYSGDEYVENWPDFLWCSNNNLVVVQGIISQLFDVDGNLLKLIDGSNGVYRVANGFIVTANSNEYFVYNSDGLLLKKVTVKPLEIGDADNGIIRYDNITYKTGEKSAIRYYKDDYGNISLVGATRNISNNGSHYTVCKYNKYGQKLACVEIPEDDVIDTTGSQLITNRIVQEPIVTNSGDIYAAVLSDSNYKIMYWKWHDDPVAEYIPDAPTNIVITPLKDSVRLVWDLSSQDPGCVVGYEIMRSDSAGGDYSLLATVPKGVYQYDDTSSKTGVTYYYKIRTVADGTYSQFSNEVSGTRSQ
jgi:hypothetical protein